MRPSQYTAYTLYIQGPRGLTYQTIDPPKKLHQRGRIRALRPAGAERDGGVWQAVQDAASLSAGDRAELFRTAAKLRGGMLPSRIEKDF